MTAPFAENSCYLRPGAPLRAGAKAHGKMGMLTRSNPAESTNNAGDGAAAPKGKRVALVIFHMGPGGAQRVVANAVGPLLDRGIELHLLLFTEREDAYPIDPRVKVHVWLPLASGAPALNDEDGDASPRGGVQFDGEKERRQIRPPGCQAAGAELGRLRL